MTADSDSEAARAYRQQHALVLIAYALREAGCMDDIDMALEILASSVASVAISTDNAGEFAAGVAACARRRLGCRRNAPEDWRALVAPPNGHA